MDTSIIGANLNANLQVQGVAQSARIIQGEQSRVIESLQTNAALREAQRGSGDSSSSVAAEHALRVERTKVHQMELELQEKSKLLVEWMHSNDVFKRLARDYGKKLEMSLEQRQEDFDRTILVIAAEESAFADTKLTKSALASLKS